jgi:hypothetical protein
MMRATRPHEQRPRLMPEGRRWGFGAHSLVPYLTAALSVRPGDHALLATIRNPVFAEMDQALRTLPQRD